MSQCPRGLRRGSTAARLLGLWVRIPPRTWMYASCECCVLSGRGLCDELVPRPEESYRVCVSLWSWSLEQWGGLGPQGAVESLEKKVIFSMRRIICVVSVFGHSRSSGRSDKVLELRRLLIWFQLTHPYYVECCLHITFIYIASRLMK
jgi:hypothetical protein